MNARRDGFTLVETMIVVVLGAVLMGSIYQMVVIQEKSTRQQYAIVQTSENVQTAIAIIANDLKEISARDSDVIAVDSTNIAVRAMRKAGIVCAKGPMDAYIDVWELGAPFVSADSVLVFADGTNVVASSDDGWVRSTVTTANVPGVPCAGNPLGVTNTRRLVLSTSMANIQQGALIRSFVPTRYRLIDSGQWGELRRTEAGGTETTIIEQLGTHAEGGLRMRFYDSAGVAIPLANLNTRRYDIMRVQIKVAGKAVAQASTTGNNRFRDSLTTQVYLRGNARSR
jgi:prepilin-type N-terminal cleavage/methylation domain-containing protein